MEKQKKADFQRNCQRMLDYLVSLQQEPIVATIRNTKKVLFERRRKVYESYTYRPSRESVRAILRYLDEQGAIKWDRHYGRQPKITILRKDLTKK